MATPYDMAFVRALMRDAGADQPTAMRCISVVDGQAQQGRSVTALQVAMHLGLIDADQARNLDATARRELQGGGPPSRPAGPPPAGGPPPRPAPPPGGPPPHPGGPPPRPAGLPPQAGGPPPRPAGPPQAGGPPPHPGGSHPGGPPPHPGGPPPRPAGAGSPPSGRAQRPSQRRPRPEGQEGPPGPAGAGPAAQPPRPAAPPPTPPSPGGTPEAAAAPAKPGETYFDLAVNGEGLDDYELGAQLGAGPAGASFRGRRKRGHAPVTLKVLNKRFQELKTLLEQVDADLAPWKAVQHERLAPFLGRGTSNGREVAVFGFAPGQPLSQVLRTARLEPGQALKAIFEVAQALEVAHKRGLAHGDVRAAKVFWDGQHATLVDGGLGRASSLAAGFGQFGLAFGHPAYMAPEVIQQEDQSRPTPATDVYALGILGYEMLCGRLPFRLEGEVIDVLRQHVESPLPPPPADVGFSAAIAGLLIRMTAKDPVSRLKDATAVVEAIRLVLAGKPLPPMPRPAGAEASAAPAQVEEFSLDAEVTADSWDRQSESVAKRKGTFDAKKLKRVGPDVFKGGKQEEEEGGGLLAAMIKAASVEQAESDDAKAKGKKRPKKPVRAGVAGPTTIGQEEAVGQGSATQKKVSLILLVLVAGGLLLGTAASTVRWVNRPPEEPPARRDPPKVDVDAIAKAQAAEQAAKEQALAEAKGFAERALGAMRAGDFRGALALKSKLSPAARSVGAAEIASVEAQVGAAAAEKLAKEELAIGELVAAGDARKAEARIRRLQSWVLDEERPKALLADLAQRKQARMLAIKKLSLEKPIEDLGGFEAKLREMARGQLTLFPGGGLAVEYGDPSQALLQDVVPLSRAKRTLFEAGTAGGERSLKLSAEGEPLFLGLTPPFGRVVDLTLELRFTEAPSPERRFAVLFGAQGAGKKHATSRGIGLEWGLRPVTLREDGTLAEQVPSPLPRLDPGQPLRLDLRIIDESSRATLEVVGTVRSGSGKPYRSAAAMLPREVSRGFIAFYVERAEVHVTFLEVRGLVDPKALE
ncbi:MAG: serine/threonine-protein kinase [Planctomycetota bacterium]